jgi:predicted DNA-binding protein (MmcQ/YjbR family)
MARAKWVHVSAQAHMTDAEVSALLRRSHELIFAKLTQAATRDPRRGVIP